jgi:hypothetical protein
MIDEVLLALAACLLAGRVFYFVGSWKAPLSFDPAGFFGLPLPPGAQRALLRRYRVWLCAPILPEVCCLAAVLYWGNPLLVCFQQTAALAVVRVFYCFVAVHFIGQAKWLAVEASWKPVASVALSLKARRLADHTSAAFEVALAVGTAASVALLAYNYLVRSAALATASGGWQVRHDFREFELPALLIYLQLGGLLAKHGLVKWRMWLPGERTEEYLRWREEVLKHVLWACDYFRWVFTAVLLFDAVVVACHGTPAATWAKGAGMLLLLVAAGAGLWPGIRSRRRVAALFAALQPLEAFTRPPQPIRAGEFRLGGLLHYDRENPSLFVPGPLVLALNLANKRAYLYFGYLTGFALLVLWIGRTAAS